MKVVISCQNCIRQYVADSDMHGKLGRCDHCKGYFTIQVAMPDIGGEAINFEHSIEPRYCFSHEATACLARNIKDALEMASEPFTPETAAKFARSMPESCEDLRDPRWRSGYCSIVLGRGRGVSLADHARRRVVVDYFLREFPGHPPYSQRALVGAFVGSLSVEFDRVAGLAVIPGKRRFWRRSC